MNDEILAGDTAQRKATGVASTINRWLQELSLKCTKARGVGDYYEVGVIGYGRRVGPALVGTMQGRDLVPISEIADNPGRLEERKRRLPDGKGGSVEQTIRIPVWFDPIADGGTPMCGAMAEAYRILQGWVAAHGDSFPPIVIHVTDGEATDGDPRQRIGALTGLSTSDGSTLLLNVHLSANPNANAVVFPDSPRSLPDEYSRMLFETASLLTPAMRKIAKEHGIKTSKRSRAFVLNSDMVQLVHAIDIGTRAASTIGSGAAVLSGPVLDVPGIEEVLEDEPDAEWAAGGEGKPTLSLLGTGEIVDATFEVDRHGRILEVIPAAPLDPGAEYRVGPGR